jgi:hypothetical protein
VNSPDSWYGEEEVEELPGVQWFVMEHLQYTDNVLADVERPRASITREKSEWYWNRVKILLFVCGEEGRWPQTSMVNVWNLLGCENCSECRTLLEFCTQYRT